MRQYDSFFIVAKPQESKAEFDTQILCKPEYLIAHTVINILVSCKVQDVRGSPSPSIHP